MNEHVSAPPSTQSRSERSIPAPAPPKSPAKAALALQRAVGNRATGRLLARWAAHPDKDKKGVFVPDAVAEGYVHFNPPKND